MLEVKVTTSKKELIANLTSQSQEVGDQYIDIVSIPTFLSTPIAFTVFNYQISNYPRRVIWTSANPKILKFLQNCQVRVVSYKDFQSKLLTGATLTEGLNKNQQNLTENQIVQQSLDKKPENIDLQALEEKKIKDRNEALELLNKLAKKSKIPIADKNVQKTTATNFKSIDSFSTKKNTTLSPEDIDYPKNKDEDETENATQEESPNNENQEQPQFSAKNLFDKNNYKPSSILEKISTSENKSKKSMQDIFASKRENLQSGSVLASETKLKSQSLDSWLERIEKTKESLNVIKNTKKTNYLNTKLPRATIKPRKKALIASLSLALLVIITTTTILASAFFSPTTVYSLTLTTKDITTQTNIKIPISNFVIEQRVVETKLETPVSGQAVEKKGQKVGKVKITNNSASPIAFDRNGIILTAANGQDYKQLVIGGEPSTYKLNSGASSILTITPVNGTAASDLKKGTRLSIYNLKNDLIGNLLLGVVTEDVTNTKITNNIKVTDADIKKSVAQVESKWDEKINQEILNFKPKDTLFWLKNWVDVSNGSDVSVSHQVGQLTNKLTVVKKQSLDFYTLSEKDLEKNLIKQQEGILDLSYVKIIDSTYLGQLNQNSEINVKLEYKARFNTEINKEDITSQLKNGEFSQNKDQITANYPAIQTISKQEKGIQIPGLKPDIEISINIE